MKKVIKIWLVSAIVIFLVIFSIGLFVKNKASFIPKEATTLESSNDITIVPTMSDKIKQDTSWCGTFQLVWNDVKNNLVKGDVIFEPEEEIVNNLNKDEFTEKMISSEDYYKIYGEKTPKLKKQIEKGIKQKFNKNSEILNGFDWKKTSTKEVPEYFFYSMLYKKFEFLYQFDELSNGEFGEKYKDVAYFGINENTNKLVRGSVNILYYNSKTDFAIIIDTKGNDQMLLVKSPEGNNFKEIFDNMNKNATKYTGSKVFSEYDLFKMPKLSLNEKREYTELEHKVFKTNNKKIREAEIAKAIQTIDFSLDKTGGEIQSEAAIDVVKATSARDKTDSKRTRYMYLDDSFVVFLREKGQSIPYFALRVDDITKFQ